MKMCLRKQKIITNLFIILMIILISGTSVFAATPDPTTGEQEIYDLADIIAGIFQKISALVIFIGGIQIAWSMASDNPEMKNQAIKIIAAGILILAMASSYDLFISKPT